MAKITKIKIYSYNGKFAPVFSHPPRWGLKKLLAFVVNGIFRFFYEVGTALIKIVTTVKKFIVSIFFFAGMVVVNFVVKVFTAAKNDIRNTGIFLPQRFRLLLKAEYFKTLAIFLLTASLGLAAVSSLHLVDAGIEIKNKVLQTTFLGKSYLNRAKNALEQGDLARADSNFYMAFQAFDRGQKQIEESGQAVNKLLNLVPQKRDADKLLKASGLISAAGQEAIGLQEDLKVFKLGPFGITVGSGSAADFFEHFGGKLEKTLAKIEQANELVNQVDEKNIPKEQLQEFVDLKGKLYVAHLTLANFYQVFDIGKDFLTGEKNVLIVFENNNELRASGGFIGTYGNLKIKDGKISKIDVSSVYDLDGQLTEVIQPPRPMLNVNDRWFLRDSNWFSDFPTSAKKISSFYELEGGQTPDIIVALTPDLIVDWLKIIGPISLPTYSVTLTAENFVEQVQAITTLSENSPSNEPKQILADLFPLLLQKLSETNEASWLETVSALQNNLNRKQLVFFSRDENLQKKLAKFHWDGSVLGTDRDFLSVVSSNLGGTKTDLAVDQKINLTTTISPNGTITNQLEITRINKMPNLPQTENLSFIRVYVPLGSKMLGNLGFDYKNLDYAKDRVYKLTQMCLNGKKTLSSTT